MRRLFTVSMAAAVFLVLFLVLTMVGSRLAPVSTVSAAAGWTAYNDCHWSTGQPITNITTYTIMTAGNKGRLINHSTGVSVTANLSVTLSGSFVDQACPQYCSYSNYPNAGTDAYTTFEATASISGGAKFAGTSNYVNLIFTGLDPTQYYQFASSANRGNSAYLARFTKFVISGVITETPASTPLGANPGITRTTTTIYSDTVYLRTGYNTVNGYVARWVNIDPGPDGAFTVTASAPYGSGDASLPAVFMLKQVDPTAVEIGSFSAAPVGDRVVLKWRTASDINRLGFNVYRATTADGPMTQVNEDLIRSPLPPGSSSGANYSFEDMPVKSGMHYFYWLEDVDLDGFTLLHGPLEANPTWRLSKVPLAQ
jgi:hypothetical protein